MKIRIQMMKYRPTIAYQNTAAEAMWSVWTLVLLLASARKAQKSSRTRATAIMITWLAVIV